MCPRGLQFGSSDWNTQIVRIFSVIMGYHKQTNKGGGLKHCVGSSNTSTRIRKNVLKTCKCLQWLGFPALTMLTFKILDCVPWEFQWVTAIHEKLCETRWHLEVWKLKFFVFCHCIPNTKCFIRSSNAITRFLKTFSNFSLTGNKQTYSTCSIYKERVRTWSDLCFKLDTRRQN